MEPLGVSPTRLFTALSGDPICSLPSSLSAHDSRVRVAEVLGIDPHAASFVRRRRLTDRAFATAESCTVVVSAAYAVACFGCGRKVRCLCPAARRSRICECVASDHRSPREVCGRCEPTYLEGDDDASPRPTSERSDWTCLCCKTSWCVCSEPNPDADVQRWAQRAERELRRACR